MHAHLRALRTAAAAQALILVFLAALVSDRHQMGEDLKLAEAATLAASLMRLPARDAVPELPKTFEDSEKWNDDVGSYLDYETFGALEAIGQFESAFDWKMPRRARMVEGVEYVFVPSAAAGTAKIAALADGWIPPCDADANGRGTPDESARRLFVLGVRTDEAADLLFGHSLAFTNVDVVYRPEELDYCYRLGAVSVLSEPDAALEDPGIDTPDALDNAVQRLGRVHGLRQDDPRDTYLAMRARFEAALIRIPILGIEARYGVALLVTAALSVGLAAWSSLLFRRLASSPGPLGEDDPTPILEPFLGMQTASGAHVVVVVLELVVVELFVVAFLAAPLVAVAALYDPLADITGTLRWTSVAILTALSVIFSASICANYARLVVRTVRHARQAAKAAASHVSAKAAERECSAEGQASAKE